MRKLNRTIVEKLFPSHIYERGLAYYNRGRVHGLSFDKQKEVWFAEVSGTQDYYVEVDLSEMQVGRVKTYCECPAFEMYDTCKHLAAMMLQISDETSIPEVKIADFMEGIIDSAPLSLNVMSDRVPMKVEYYLTFERSNKVWLELKTGVDHCYVVRNIRELLEHVLQEERHYFTNKFSYEPERSEERRVGKGCCC